MDIKAIIKSKGLGYWLCTGAAVVSFILAIVVFATWDNALPNRVTDGYLIGIILLIPIVLQAVFTFFPVRFAGVLSVAVYGLAFGAILLRIADTVADFFNKVAFQGGNFGICIFYAVLCLILDAACIASCFFDQNKEEKYLI